MTRSPAATGWSPIRSSLSTCRNMLLSGVTQRMTSSTSPGSRAGSAAAASHWSGWSASTARPRAMAVRVVSAPPAMNSPVSCIIVSGSMPAPAHTEMRSSAGQPLRSAAMSCSRALNSMIAFIIPISASLSKVMTSVRISRSDHDFTSSQRSSGKPSRSAVSRDGSCAARSCDHLELPLRRPPRRAARRCGG